MTVWGTDQLFTTRPQAWQYGMQFLVDVIVGEFVKVLT
jgi:hypothetical protein